MENLKQGTRVEYDVQTLKGKGTIVGMSVNELPIIGATYIIEPDEPIQNEVYDYTHFAVPMVCLKVINETEKEKGFVNIHIDTSRKIILTSIKPYETREEAEKGILIGPGIEKVGCFEIEYSKK